MKRRTRADNVVTQSMEDVRDIPTLSTPKVRVKHQVHAIVMRVASYTLLLQRAGFSRLLII